MDLFRRLTGKNRSEITCLTDLIMFLSRGWKSYIKWMSCGLAIGLIICFSIPKEYKVNILLAPEVNESTIPRLNASQILFDPSSSSVYSDAYYTVVYGDIINSIPFIYDLLSVSVIEKGNKNIVSIQEILKSEKKAWWNLSRYNKTIQSNASQERTTVKTTSLPKYSEEQMSLIRKLQQRILVITQEKTGGIELEVTMQDPLVTVLLADTIIKRFEKYIVDYRTQKAKEELRFTITQEDMAKRKWYQCQDTLARFSDHHSNIVSAEDKILYNNLLRETNIARQSYQAAVLAHENAEVNLIEERPVFTVVSPASVPQNPVSPNKLVILSYFLFFSLFISMVKFLFSQN